MELVNAFGKISGHEIPYTVTDRRPGDLAAVWANPSCANAELGWKADLTIEDAIHDTLKFLELHNS